MTLSSGGELLDGPRGSGLANDAGAGGRTAILRNPDLETSARLVDEEDQLAVALVGAEDLDSVVAGTRVQPKPLGRAIARDVELNDRLGLIAVIIRSFYCDRLGQVAWLVNITAF